MTKKSKTSKNNGCQYISLNDPETYFYSYDLGIVASLISDGFELISIDKQNPQKVLFIVRRTPDLDDKLNAYFSDLLMVPARSFFENVKMLKNRIYNSL